MAARNLAEEIVAVLAAGGVERMFGIPGGGSSLDLIDAGARAGIDFVLARTETAAAFMAAVTGELTETPGVVLVGIGPGAAAAVNGVAYAHLERAPLILFTDGPAASLHQAFDQNALFRPVSKLQARLTPEDGGTGVRIATATAMTPPYGPVQLDMTAPDAARPVNPEYAAPPPAAPSDLGSVETARTLLAQARRPVILAGLEARYAGASAGLKLLADGLNCPVMPTYKAKGVLSDRHPALVGPFTGAAAEADCLGKADLIILYGLDPVEIIPGPWTYTAPILDLSRAGNPEVPNAPACRLVGPLNDLVAAIGAVDRENDWAGEEIAGLRARLARRLDQMGRGATSQSAVQALAAVAPPGCRVTVDAGAHMFSVFANWAADEPFGMLKSNGLSTMGFALPAAIASALAEPDRPVVAVTGDGGLMMCLGELATAAERALPLTVVVLNDAALSLIDAKQQRQQRPSIGVRTPSFDFAAAARGLGCHGIRVEAGGDLTEALGAALAHPGPAVVDVVVDPSGYVEQLAALRG